MAGASLSGQSGASGALNALSGGSSGGPDGSGGFSAALASLMKVTQFKNTAQMTRVQVNQPSRSERLRQQEEAKIIMSTENLEQLDGKAEESKKADYK